MNKIKYQNNTYKIVALALSMASVNAFSFSSTDPEPGISCEKAESTVQETWWKPGDEPGSWNRRIETKYNYCFGSSAATPELTDPSPWLSCEQAEASSLSDWYDPDTIDPDNYSFTITEKLQYCSSSGHHISAKLTDTEPHISCERALSDSKEIWYNKNETDPDNWNYRITQKLNFCIASNYWGQTQTNIDPEPGITCDKARHDSLEPWYNPNETDPTNWNYRITQKLKYCDGTSPPITNGKICQKWQPGNFIRVFHDSLRNKNAVQEVNSVLNQLRNEKAISLFKGFVVQLQWGEIEKSQGVYNYSVIDNILAKINSSSDSQHMKIMLLLSDRTFHNGCSSKVAPAGIPREGSGSKCWAKTWEKQTSQKYINFVGNVYNHYKNNKQVLGSIMWGESAVAAPSAKNNPSFYTTFFQRYAEGADTLLKKYPYMITSFGINWPNDRKYFDPLAKQLRSMSGGSLTWPDSVPPPSYYGPNDQFVPSGLRSNRDHYNVAKESSRNLVVVAGIQNPWVLSHKEESERIYRYLSNDMKAQILVWETGYYNSDLVKKWPDLVQESTYGNNYFRNSVIPTVKKYGGKIQNTTCPSPRAY